LFDEYDADELTIYLAKKQNDSDDDDLAKKDRWLRSDDDDVSQLRKGNVTMGIRANYFKPELKMNSNSLLRNTSLMRISPKMKSIMAWCCCH
jgi:hypothetical protein